MSGLYRTLADAIGNPGRVWCRECGRSQKVDAAKCLASGWPECCGYTMTIDPPETHERCILSERAEHERRVVEEVENG